jgi:hypothetical protein
MIGRRKEKRGKVGNHNGCRSSGFLMRPDMVGGKLHGNKGHRQPYPKQFLNISYYLRDKTTLPRPAGWTLETCIR